jgi:hypothetical protein
MNNIDTSVVAAQAYKLKMTIKSLEKQYDGLMTTLKESFNQGQPRWGSYVMVMSQRPGSVDYSSIPELKSVDLDKYRKDPVSVYKLEYTGDE